MAQSETPKEHIGQQCPSLQAIVQGGLSSCLGRLDRVLERLEGLATTGLSRCTPHSPSESCLRERVLLVDSAVEGCETNDMGQVVGHGPVREGAEELLHRVLMANTRCQRCRISSELPPAALRATKKHEKDEPGKQLRHFRRFRLQDHA